MKILLNPPNSTKRLPHWMIQAFNQVEPNLVSEPIVIPSDTSLPLPENLTLPATRSTISQIPTTTFPLNFPTNLDDRYREFLFIKIPLRLDWNSFVAPLLYLVNILISVDYILGHSTNCNTDRIFTKTYKNTIYNFLH